MFKLILLFYLLPVIVSWVIRKYPEWKNTHKRRRPLESSIEKTLAEIEISRRFETSWQTINRHDPHAVDPDAVVRTPEERMLEDHLARDRDSWHSEIRMNPDPHISEPD